MQVPDWFEEQLRLVESNLLVRWEPRRQRWQILRRNPRRPNAPPDVVCTVQEQNGSFRPLDRRTIQKLYRMDVYRRHSGAEWYLGRRVEAELDDDEIEIQRKKQARRDEMYNELFDRAKFFYKEEERHGRRLA